MVYGTALSKNFPSGLVLIATMSDLPEWARHTHISYEEWGMDINARQHNLSHYRQKNQLVQQKSLGYQTTYLFRSKVKNSFKCSFKYQRLRYIVFNLK